MGYIGASAWLLLSIYSSEDSTAALGFLFVPLLLWAGMLIAVDVERSLAWWVSLRRQHRGGEGQAAGARMGSPAWWQWLWPTGTTLALLSLLSWKVYVALAAVIWSMAGVVVAKAGRRQERTRPGD